MTHILVTGRRKTPVDVFTSTTLTIPSWPGCTATTRPRGQLPRGMLLSQMTTTSSICTGRDGLSHLVRRVRVGRYSFIHLFRKWSARRCATHHCFLIRKSSSLKTPGGLAALVDPIKKLNGVRLGSSSASPETYDRGLLLTTASPSVNTVLITSSFGACWWRIA